MKKLVIFIVALMFVLPLFSIERVCAEGDATDYKYISAEEIDTLTRNICEDMPDRTTFSPNIKSAAEKLAGVGSSSDSQLLSQISQNSAENTGYLSTINAENTGYLSTTNLDIEVRPFTVSFNVQQGFSYQSLDLTSYNVIASPKVYDADKKTILIATDFSNLYSAVENFTSSGTKAEGALGTAATTALAVKLANYLSRPEIASASPYNFKFAFFSGTYEGNYGSEAFMNELTDDIMLAVNLERLGCGATYYYTDEVKTTHGEFIEKFSKNYDLKEFSMTGRILLPMQTISDVPYAHYAIKGNNATFMSRGIASLELIGGDFSGLSDNEGGKVNITYTNLDTYENLKNYYPDYADKLAKAATFIIELTNEDGLESVCKGAASSYKVFTKEWIAYAICLGIIVILILVMILVISRFEKKYPIPKAPKIKIAVFGKEFEDENDNEIIVDIKRKDDNPFDV